MNGLCYQALQFVDIEQLDSEVIVNGEEYRANSNTRLSRNAKIEENRVVTERGANSRILGIKANMSANILGDLRRRNIA